MPSSHRPSNDGTSSDNLADRLEAAEKKIESLKSENKRLRSKSANNTERQQKRVQNNNFKLMDDINKFLDSLDDKINKITDNIDKRLDKILDNLVDGSTKKASQAVDDITDDIEDSVQEAVESAEDTILGSFKKQKKEIEDLVDKLTDFTEDAFSDTTGNIDREINEAMASQALNHIKELARRFDEFYKQNHRSLTRQNQQEFALYAKRISEIDNIERRWRERMKDMKEEATEFTEEFGEQIEEIKNSLLEWANALNLDAIRSGLGEVSSNIVSTTRDMQNSLHLTAEETEKYINKVYETASKTLQNKINASELNEQLNSAMGGMSVETREQYMEPLSRASMALNVDASTLRSILALDANKQGNGQVLEAAAATILNLQKSGIKEFDTEAVIESIGDLTNALSITYRNPETAAKGIAEMITASAVAANADFGENAGALMSDLNSAITQAAQILTAEGAAEFMRSDFYKALGQNGNGFIQAVQSGNTLDAYRLALAGVGSSGDLGMMGLSPEAQQGYYEFGKQILNDLNTISDKNFIQDSLSNQTALVQEAIDNFDVPITEQFMNFIADSPIGQAYSWIQSHFDIDLSDILVVMAAVKTLSGKTGGIISKFLGKGGKSLFSNIGGGAKSLVSNIGKSVKNAVSSIGTGVKTGKGKGLSGILSGIQKSLVMNKGANVAAKAAGMGQPGAIGNILSGAGKSGGGILSKIFSVGGKALGGIGGGLALGLDAFTGAGKAEEWFGNNDIMSQVVSGFSSMLGGTGKGIMDPDSDIMTKVLDVGGGALKGAGVGMIGGPIGAGIGAILGGIGSAIGGQNIANFMDAMGFTKLPELMGQFWQDLCESDFGKFFQNAVDSFGNLFRDIGGWFSEVGRSFANLFGGIGQWIADRFTDVGNWIMGALSFIGDLFWNSPIGQAMQGLADIIMASPLGDAINAVGNWLGQLGQWLSDFVSNPFKFIGNVLTGGSTEKVVEKASEATLSRTSKKSDGTGRKGDDAVLINPLAGGLKEVPFDEFPALLHKGESVLTSQQASLIRNNTADGGLDVSQLVEDHGFGSNLTTPVARPIPEATDLIDGNNLFDEGYGYEGFENMNGQDPISLINENIKTFIDLYVPADKRNKDWYNAYRNNTTQIISAINKAASAASSAASRASSSAVTASTSSSASSSSLSGGGSGGSGGSRGSTSGSSGYPYTTFTDAQLKVKSKTRNEAWQKLRYLVEGRHMSMQMIPRQPLYSRKAGVLDNDNAVLDHYRLTNKFPTTYNGVTVKYAKGTPFVPEDQVAVVHKGEAIIPADFNPYANGENMPIGGSDDAEIINVIRWAVGRIEKKLDEVKDSQKTENSSDTRLINNYSNEPSATDVVFTF